MDNNQLLEVCSCINSDIVSKYLYELFRSQSWRRFSLLESAWIVAHSKKKSLDEKIKIWKHLLELPDKISNDIEEYYLEDYNGSVHKLINTVIEDAEKTKQNFFTPNIIEIANGTIKYSVKYRFAEDNEYIESHIQHDSPQQCIEEIKYWNHKDDLKNIVAVIITQITVSDYKAITTDLYTDLELNVFDIDCSYIHIFDEMYFSFPTPFMENDLVTYYKSPYDLSTKEICLLKEIDNSRIYKVNDINKDSSDMIFWGYWVDDHKIYFDHVVGYTSYMDLEYYNFTEDDKDTDIELLYLLKLYQDEKIDISSLLNYYLKYNLNKSSEYVLSLWSKFDIENAFKAFERNE